MYMSNRNKIQEQHKSKQKLFYCDCMELHKMNDFGEIMQRNFLTICQIIISAVATTEKHNKESALILFLY